MTAKQKTPMLALLFALCLAAPAALATDYGWLRGVPLRSSGETPSMQLVAGQPVGGEMLGHGVAWEPTLAQARSLLGFRIENAKGEKLADVEDLVLDKNHSRIVFVVASHGGFWGIRDKLTAIPYAALEPQMARSAFVLNVDKTLAKAPGFSPMSWPDLASEKFAREVYGYYGLTVPAGLFREEGMAVPETIVRGETSLCRLAKLTGFPIRVADREIGRIDQILFDMTEGRPVYVYLTLTEADQRDKLSVVPWTSVDLRPADRTILVKADLPTLRAVAYARGSLPNLADPLISGSIHETFGGEPYWNVYGYIRPSEEMAAPVGWDPKAILTLSGVIEKRHILAVLRGHEFVHVLLKTGEGKIVSVKLCPDTFLTEKGFGLAAGDKITVTGCWIGTGEKMKFVAQKIDKNGKILMLRNEKGIALFHVGKMTKGLGTEKMKTEGTTGY